MVDCKKCLVSACLIGELCRYDAKAAKNTGLLDTFDENGIQYIPVCPEVLGGLPIPRSAAQIQKGDGHDVLQGKSDIIDTTGRNVTNSFIAGAAKVLDIAIRNDIKMAVLNERSPSCGVNQIYNDERIVEGAGIVAALLSRNGITVLSDEDFVKNLR